MNKPRTNVFFYVSLCIIFLLSLFIFQKINLTTADLGRHVMNGKLFIQADSLNISRNALLHTNFFSFTNPDFPFVNHHWGSGILFYLIFSVFGFSGLSLLYGICILSGTILLYYLFRHIPLLISFPIMLFLIPLIAERTEVRPEGLSYLFISIIIALLYLYSTNQISKKWLYAIPFISLIFVNTHIYFIFAPFIVGMFLLEALIRRDLTKSKDLAIILGLSTLAIFINPYGLQGVIYPFVIFKNYGYLIAENQSIPFLIHLGINNPNFILWKLATGFLIFTSGIIFLKHRTKFPIALFGISTAFAILSFFGIRHLTAYGLTLIPLFLYYASILYKKPEKQEKVENHIFGSITISIILLIFVAFHFSDRLPWSTDWGIGLLPEVNASADFFKMQHLAGPIFSNYDIGGYLIYHLYPEEKFFVDNRPEAYPASFFQNEYIPMQNDETVWNTELIKWNFNVIYFQRKDMTPWAQSFLITRIRDPLWAPVFVDNYTIIFLRRNEKNADIIKKYELPKSMFSVK